MKPGDLIKYENDGIYDTGVVINVDLEPKSAQIIRVQWVSSGKPEWIIYHKDIIKIIAEG